jgi:hypothetical protein
MNMLGAAVTGVHPFTLHLDSAQMCKHFSNVGPGTTRNEHCNISKANGTGAIEADGLFWQVAKMVILPKVWTRTHYCSASSNIATGRLREQN